MNSENAKYQINQWFLNIFDYESPTTKIQVHIPNIRILIHKLYICATVIIRSVHYKIQNKN